MPTVSVIIPNYNHALYLKQRIDSVLAQSFSDIEIIILDDCSTDHSKDVIEQYRNNSRISHIIYNEHNSGSTFKQWKRGIELAKGEWIWIAESDDWCEPVFLEELLKPVKEHKDLVIALCQSVLITPENKILYTTYADKLSEIFDGQHFVRTRMLATNYIVNASMAIFRKSAFVNVPSGYEQMMYCGDWMFWTHIALQGKVYVSGKYLNYYLRHENNVATTAVKKGYDFLEGNQVYEFITQTIDVAPEEKKEALAVKNNMYFDRKALFLDEAIKQQVLESMLALDPCMKAMIQQRVRINKRQEFRSIIRRYLTYFK
jgi:glycosyltransferase involved in cell wall biosynthesis